jgi:polyhydroxyalkanoate synthesis regulator phasin
LEDEYHAIAQALRRIERWQADGTGKREIMEQGLEELKRQMAALQARVQALEQRVRE